MIRFLLLASVPVAPVLHYGFHAPPLLVFATGLLGVGVLAEWIRAATDELAIHTGPALGGLLSVSLGSLAELILALFVLAGGQAAVVHAQITGSILGTALLGLGLSIVVGGAGREKQVFGRERAGLLSTMLILSTVALMMPAVFDYAGRHVTGARDVAVSDETISLLASAVLLLLYAANMVYTLVTHRDVFARGEAGQHEEAPNWSVGRCLLVLGAATAGAALEAELISSELEAASGTLGLSPVFMGVVVLALVGTIADLFSAVFFAREDRMGLVMSICLGSAIQVALVVAPLLVILSWFFGSPMTLVFRNPLDLFAIAATVFVVNSVTGDGETTWFEGALLIGVYVLFAIAFFFA